MAGVLLARVIQPGLHREFAGPIWILALALPVLTSIGLQFLPGNEVAVDIAMVLIAISAMLWFAICCGVPGRYSRLLQAVGGLSFPIYALHVPIITLVSDRFGGIQGGIVAAGAVGLAACCVTQYAVLLGPIPSRRAAKPALL